MRVFYETQKANGSSSTNLGAGIIKKYKKLFKESFKRDSSTELLLLEEELD